VPGATPDPLVARGVGVGGSEIAETGVARPQRAESAIPAYDGYMPIGPLARSNLTPTRTTAALTALLVLLAAVGGVAAVPDARIAIDGIDASTTDPVVGERTSLNVSLSNSGGSPSAADVTSVRVVDAGADDDADPLDEATAVGALSPGDATDVTLWTRFDEPGERRVTVEVVAEAEAEDGEDPATVTVTRDVVVDVQPAVVTSTSGRAGSPRRTSGATTRARTPAASASTASRGSSAAVAAGSTRARTPRRPCGRPTPRWR